MNFDEKVILVTGGSSGIGAAAARYLAKLGANVVIVGRNMERLNGVAEDILKDGSSAPLPIVADITKDTERIIDETIKKFGKLDVLINNAGTMKTGQLSASGIQEYDRMHDVNVRAALKLSQLAVPHLEKTKGNIINVSSMSGLSAHKIVSLYGMTKATVDVMTKYLAVDLASKKIRVNSICPGFIKTPASDRFNYEKALEYAEQKSAVRRIGTVSETSTAIAYLASEKSSFITGTVLRVDGGKVLKMAC